MRYPAALVVVASTLLLLGPMSVRSDDTAKLAESILDDAKDQGEREKIIADHPERSAELIAAMTEGLEGRSDEETRRIPWIWRVAVAAGKRNDAAEVRRILDVSLPKEPGIEPWRVVVIGGGIINGIGLAGDWPQERIAAIVGEDDVDLGKRWLASLGEAMAMLNDEAIFTGTRYDALRMVAMLPWDECGGPLFRHLMKGVHPELQQGAISGLSDVRSPCVAPALLTGIRHYSPENLAFALDALLRSDDRMVVLLDAVEEGRVTAEQLGAKRVERLMDHREAGIRERARLLLTK